METATLAPPPEPMMVTVVQKAMTAIATQRPALCKGTMNGAHFEMCQKTNSFLHVLFWGTCTLALVFGPIGIE
jgi:hypothetical protein